MRDPKQREILELIRKHPSLSSKEIHDAIVSDIGYSTVKRILSKLISQNLVVPRGEGRGRKYLTSPSYELFSPIDMEEYFKKEIDERVIRKSFNIALITDVLYQVKLFTEEETQHLSELHKKYTKKKSRLTPAAYSREMERLSIDLSWKSSQIEGNTYSLLETERLLKEKETAEGKGKDEAIMLLNHKEAIDYIINDPDSLFPLDRWKIEKIHTLLMNGLGVEFSLRTTGAGITGTNYTPPEYEIQISRALNEMCKLVNCRESALEKALLLLTLISYIQPFVDGNKRTARIMSNAVLIKEGYCPVSFRTIDSLEFKKAILLFYEQNNMSPIKEIFIGQFEFAVNTYFLA